MATVVNDLVTKFSFVGDTDKLDEYNTGLGGSIGLLAAFYTTLAAGSAAFAVWADGVLTGVDALDKLSNETGVAVGKIQELNFIAGQTQSTAAAVESTIRGLGQTIGQAAQQGSEDFARLGISVRDSNGQIKKADVVLGEVGARFKSLSLSLNEQQHFASALGIDTSLLQAMGKTGAELANMRDRARELGVLTDEQAEQAGEYKQALNGLWFGLNSVKQLVAIGVAPELSKLAANFTQLLADNKDWIVEGIQATVRWVGNLFDAFARLTPVFAIVVAGFVAMKLAAGGFAVVAGVLLSPVVLVTAAIVTLLAIVDDLIVAFDGGNSVIANFFKDTFDIDIVKALTRAFEFLVTNGLGPMRLAFDTIAGAIGFAFGGLKMLVDLIADFVQSDAFSAVLGLFDGLPSFFGFGDATPSGQIPPSGFNIPPGAGAPTAGMSTDNRRIDQNNEINIFTNDAAAAGRAVSDGLQGQLENANTQLAVGGR
jgi:hypothetical protein